MRSLKLSVVFHFAAIAMIALLINSCRKPERDVSIVTDIDGNVYHTVVIGQQEWTVKNLRATRLNDGGFIAHITSNYEWNSMATPAFCWFNNNDSVYKKSYGALYNWYTINTGKLCPKGWRVPGDADWKQLTDFLLGETVAGGKLKETGTENWLSPNRAATNETGFTALPGGQRSTKGKFEYLGYYSIWWSSTSSNSNAWCRLLNYENSLVYRYEDDKRTGLSVRCMRDISN